MQGRQDRWQDDLFVACRLCELIPEDHILKRVDKVLDLSWLHEEVSDLYCADNGRPSIDPEAAVRLMLAGFFEGIVHDRKLLRNAQVNIAMRWFAGYKLHEKLPDHSSLTRIRQRWGAERFRRIFARTVQACLDADLVSGETVHIDATLIRADVSWASLVEHHAQQVLSENAVESDDPAPGGDGPAAEDNPERRAGRPCMKRIKAKKISTTDPDATLTTSNKGQRMEPCYKQHTAVDDRAGVILDVALTTGEASEGEQLIDQIDRVEAATGIKVRTATADAAYAHGGNYAELEERKVDAVIPPQAENNKPKNIPMRRFKYDAKHKIVRCPGGKTLHRSSQQANGWLYRARAGDCRACPLRERCFSAKASARVIHIRNGYEALLRARRRRLRWDEPARGAYRRHRWRVEGVHGEAKTQHGLRRAVRRSMANVAIQMYLTAAVMNLKRLAALFVLLWRRLEALCEHMTFVGAAPNELSRNEALFKQRVEPIRKAA